MKHVFPHKGEDNETENNRINKDRSWFFTELQTQEEKKPANNLYLEWKGDVTTNRTDIRKVICGHYVQFIPIYLKIYVKWITFQNIKFTKTNMKGKSELFYYYEQNFNPNFYHKKIPTPGWLHW